MKLPKLTEDHWHSFAGELLGTFILVFFGCASVAVTVLFKANTGVFGVAAVWGIGVALAIYATRHLSCAHLNPAVSLAMVIAGRMIPKKLPTYMVSQLTGAFLAGAFVYFLFSGQIAAFEQVNHIVRGSAGSVSTAMILGDYFPNPGVPLLGNVSLFTALLAEATGTFILVMMVFLLTEGCNVGRPASDTAPVLIGLTITALIGVLAPLTQAGLNPARDFGPRLFAYLAGWGSAAIPAPNGGFYVYIAGPFIGAAIAAMLFARVIEPLMKAKAGRCGCG